MISSSEINHLLPNAYVKQEPYSDIYGSSTAENDLAGYSQAYERTVA